MACVRSFRLFDLMVSHHQLRSASSPRVQNTRCCAIASSTNSRDRQTRLWRVQRKVSLLLARMPSVEMVLLLLLPIGTNARCARLVRPRNLSNNKMMRRTCLRCQRILLALRRRQERRRSGRRWRMLRTRTTFAITCRRGFQTRFSQVQRSWVPARKTC